MFPQQSGNFGSFTFHKKSIFSKMESKIENPTGRKFRHPMRRFLIGRLSFPVFCESFKNPKVKFYIGSDFHLQDSDFHLQDSDFDIFGLV